MRMFTSFVCVFFCCWRETPIYNPTSNCEFYERRQKKKELIKKRNCNWWQFSRSMINMSWDAESTNKENVSTIVSMCCCYCSSGKLSTVFISSFFFLLFRTHSETKTGGGDNLFSFASNSIWISNTQTYLTD